MRKIQLALLVFALALFGCKTKRAVRRGNEIAKISFATGGCDGFCPLLSLEVDSSLTYKFYGGKYCEKPGYYTGRISPEFWDSLNMEFERIHFKALDSSYEHSVDDLSTRTIITYGNARKVINAQSASLPDSVRRVLDWLMNSYKKVALTPTLDTLDYPRIPVILPPVVMPPSTGLKVAAHLIYDDGSLSDFDVLNDKTVALWNTIIGAGDVPKPSHNTRVELGGSFDGVHVRIRDKHELFVDTPIVHADSDVVFVLKNTGCEEVYVTVTKKRKVLYKDTIPFHCGE